MHRFLLGLPLTFTLALGGATAMMPPLAGPAQAQNSPPETAAETAPVTAQEADTDAGPDGGPDAGSDSPAAAAPSATTAPAAVDTPEMTRLKTLLRTPVSAADFTPEMLAQAPLPQLRTVLSQVAAALDGPMLSVTPTGDGYVISDGEMQVPARIALDAQGRVAGLWFGGAEVLSPDLEAALAALRALPGRRSLLVVRDGQVEISDNGDMPLAVGSAFKLGVLAALKRQVDAGLRRWDDTVTLEGRHRSLPTGVLQDWPDGTALTLQSLAALMISQSDNTATDLLMEVLGREAVAEALGAPVPLTTREFFILRADPVLARLYDASAAPGRLDILADLADDPLPPVSSVTGAARHGVEWYLPAGQLCALMAEVAPLPLMTINPGPAAGQGWARVAYKGGSEPGVLNLTSQLDTDAGRYCVAYTMNTDDLSREAEAISAYRALLQALRAQD